MHKPSFLFEAESLSGSSATKGSELTRAGIHSFSYRGPLKSSTYPEPAHFHTSAVNLSVPVAVTDHPL